MDGAEELDSDEDSEEVDTVEGTRLCRDIGGGVWALGVTVAFREPETSGVLFTDLGGCVRGVGRG